MPSWSYIQGTICKIMKTERLRWPEMLLILGRSGTQYVVMVTKLLSLNCDGNWAKTEISSLGTLYMLQANLEKLQAITLQNGAQEARTFLGKVSQPSKKKSVKDLLHSWWLLSFVSRAMTLTEASYIQNLKEKKQNKAKQNKTKQKKNTHIHTQTHTHTYIPT